MDDDLLPVAGISDETLKQRESVQNIAKYKRKQSLLLSEYLSKKRKKHNVKKAG